jgi:hypothetical protein
MNETSPDMNQAPTESGRETPKPTPERLSSEEGDILARRAKLEEEMAKELERSEEEADRITAGLKRIKSKDKPIILSNAPSKQTSGTVRRVVGLGVSWPFGQGIYHTGKLVGMGLSSVFTAMEKAGQETLQKFKFLNWVPLIGPWLLNKPDESWAEKAKKEEEEKKREREKKRKESEKVEKLQKKGISDDVAKALIEGTEPDKESEPSAPEKESSKEEKAA